MQIFARFAFMALISSMPAAAFAQTIQQEITTQNNPIPAVSIDPAYAIQDAFKATGGSNTIASWLAREGAHQVALTYKTGNASTWTAGGALATAAIDHSAPAITGYRAIRVSVQMPPAANNEHPSVGTFVLYLRHNPAGKGLEVFELNTTDGKTIIRNP